MHTRGFLCTASWKLETNRCLNFFSNFGKLHNHLKLENSEKKKCLDFLAFLILFPEPTQSCNHTFSSDQVSRFKNKDETPTTLSSCCRV